MNKYYSILGIGLLSSMALTSCNKDVIDSPSDNNNPYNEIHDFTVNATIGNVDTKSSRANIGEDGKSFLWNKGDKISVWNGTEAHTFTISSLYDEAKFASASVPFYYDGENPWEGVSSVWGIYPELSGSEAEQNITVDGNTFTFKLNTDIALTDETQDNKPHLNSTMYMLGKGDVTGTEATSIQFEHLTSMFQFELNNFREEPIILKSLKIEASDAVFAKTLTITDGVKSYSDMTNTVSVTFGAGLNLEAGAEISRFVNLFPTTSMTAQTTLTFKAVYDISGGGSDFEQVLKSGTVNDLYTGQPLATTDGYQYVAGKRYIINLRPELPADERGYKKVGDEKFEVMSGAGLHNLLKYEMNAISSERVEISLADNIDMDGITYTPIDVFKGVFDGKGKVISNLTIARNDNMNAMFIENSGTIKNLKLENANLTANFVGLNNCMNGILVSTNKGLIENVSVAGNIESQGTYTNKDEFIGIGGLAGVNDTDGKIQGCKVLSGTTIRNATTANPNIGGLVCINKGEIKGSAVENGVTIEHAGIGGIRIGGFVSIFQNGRISASSSETDIQIKTENDLFAGGFIGDAYQGTLYIEGCYSGGQIKKAVSGTGTLKCGAFISRGTWQWGFCKLNISGCYTVTAMKDFGGGIAGLAIANGFIGSVSFAKPDTELNTKACYWFNAATKDTQDETNAEVNLPDVDKTQSIADIQNYMSAMNSVITETGYEYVIGDSNIPLKLQTSDPGFGAPDFGDGEELK